MPTRPHTRALAALTLCGLLLSACGGEKKDPAEPAKPKSAELRRQLDAATATRAADFPAVSGRSLQEVADGLGAAGPQLGLATSVLTTGTNRLAFGVIDPQSGFVYGPTAIYVARSETAAARGPFPAPADLLLTDSPYRSRQAASEDDPFSAIYAAQVEFDKPGTYAILAATKVNGQLVGAGTKVTVIPASRDRIPAVGDRAPVTDTDTVAASGGIDAVETRIPPDDMHDVNLRDVLGKRPVALLFATPQLCQSRVCGPVTDILFQLERKYGDRIAFIHQEVYVDNVVEKGLREPLKRFGLRTEPWFFAIDADGRIVSRLEGSFGFKALDEALAASLR